MHLPAMRDLLSLRDDLNRTRIEFLRTDLETGIMLAQIAATSKDSSERQKRNTRHARLAYDTVMRFRYQVQLSTDAVRVIDAKLAQLRLMLEMLGESFA